MQISFAFISLLCKEVIIVCNRERPTGNSRGIMEDLPNTETEGALLGLPETQTELDVSTFSFNSKSVRHNLMKSLFQSVHQINQSVINQSINLYPDF